jgi:hypothetical protein
MKTIGQIFSDLRDSGFFNTQHYLGAESMLSNNDISKYQLTSINREKYIYILNIKNDNDIVLGEKFNVVFDIKNPKNYQKTKAEIDFVSLKKDDKIGIIPRGHGGCVRLMFKDKVPEITKLLLQDNDEKFDKEKHSYLYFTTQEVMDRILEELDKQENSNV